jgi:uncharacterized protein (DUF58 family)
MGKGWRWLWVVGGLIALALALQAGLVAFAGYVLVGVYLLSRYLANQWAKNLAVERKVDGTPLQVGESRVVTLKFRNTGSIPIGWVLVEEMLPEAAVRQGRIAVKGPRIQVLFLRPGQVVTAKMTLTFKGRGYYPVGPTLAETGDLFGFYRRHRTLSKPVYVLVLPAIVNLPSYDFASKRPIGETRLANRLFEDPTRTAGVRPYQMGDPLQRVHWRATARTGELHSRVYEPTSLAGVTVLIDFHKAGYPKRGEPTRSDLAVSAACAIAYAVSLMNQQLGLASNGRDAAERVRAEALETPAAGGQFDTRGAARDRFELTGDTTRLRPVVVETRRGFDQFQQVREVLGRLELTDGSTFAQMLFEVAPRLPRDATVVAVLPAVSVDTAVALGMLRRQGFAISAVLVGLADDGTDDRAVAAGRLVAEGVRDVRFVDSEKTFPLLGDAAASSIPPDYGFQTTLA